MRVGGPLSRQNSVNTGQERSMTDNMHAGPGVQEIDPAAIVAILWRRRRLIILGTLIATILAAGIGFVIPRVYRSEAFYQLSGDGVSIPLYKSSSSMFTNPNRLLAFMGRQDTLSVDEKRRLAGQFVEAQDIQDWVEPLYSYSKEDQRLLAQGGKSVENAVLGLNLAFEADAPKKAAKMVLLLGRYVRDCLMYSSLLLYITDGAIDAHIALQRNENDLSENRFRLQQQERKMLDIRAVLRKYPEAASGEGRQLVSIQDGGARYLSPVTQLVGIESMVADLRREAAELQRNREKSLLRVEYFDLGKGELERSEMQGERLFRALRDARQGLFARKDINRDPIREVFNELSIDDQQFDRAFYLSYRFVSGPTLPARHAKPSRILIVAAAGLLSLCFFVFLALGLHWWQEHKQGILLDQVKG
jgi:hypothetical protein